MKNKKTKTVKQAKKTSKKTNNTKKTTESNKTTKTRKNKTKKTNTIKKTTQLNKSIKKPKNKTKKTSTVKKTREKKLNNLMQFIAILTIAAILLSYLMATERQMTFEKRLVGNQVTSLLKLTGINANFYEQVIRINNYPGKNQAIMQLSRYLNEKKQVKGQTEIRAKHIHPDDEKIIQEYIKELQQQGNPVYYSTAYIITNNGKQEMQIEIIPECIGWIGLFAITALILATPRIKIRKKLKALIIALPLMYAVNILRLTTTTYIGYKAGETALHFTHDLLWRTILIGTAIIIWLAWYSKNKPN